MKNVLIVEDDPMVAMINTNYIELLEGFECVGCVTEEDDIIEKLNKEHIDLIILDVYLPKKSGLEILKSLRDEGHLVDIIMVTAANKTEEIKKAFAYGVVDYLVKPFELERFNEGINKYIIKNNILNEKQGLMQNDIDNICLSGIEKGLELPKGLQRRTLDKIIDLIKSYGSKTWTIREISCQTDISNVTVKKYMDYLENTKRVKSDPYYGNVGRPEYKYTFLK